MRGIRANESVVIVGQNGRGKSVLALYLMSCFQPVRSVVIDSKAEHTFPGVTPARTAEELAARMRDPWVHYIPPPFDREELEAAFEVIWQTPGPLRVWVDEGAHCSNPTWCPRGLARLATQGRLPEKTLLTLTQRLSGVHAVLRSEAKHFYVFVPPPVELDLKVISGHVRREAGELDRMLRELHANAGDFAHLWYVQDTDELRECEPLPIPERAPSHLPSRNGAGAQPSAPSEAAPDGPDSPPCASSDSPSGPS